jgi:hypothetical protein
LPHTGCGKNAEQVFRDPLRGQLLENLAVTGALRTRFNRNKDVNLFYYRYRKRAWKSI